MTLQQLIYFHTACRHGNLSRAAEELHVSQPSVSAAIKNLENEFGVILIRRRSTGFVLTEEGETLRELAQGLISHAERVTAVMAQSGNERRTVRLGMPPMAGAILLPRIYAEFCAANPEVELSTVESGRGGLLEQLDDNRLDVAFLAHAEAFPPQYQSVPVTQYETVCCVSPDHPLAGETVIRVPQLKDRPLVFFSKGFFQNERIGALCAQAGVEPLVMHTSSQLSTVTQLIRSNIAAGFLFREVAQMETDMVGIPLDPPVYTNISLVWKKDRYLCDSARAFIEYVKTTSGDNKQ